MGPRPKTAHVLRGPACTLCDVIKFGFFHQVRLLISIGLDLEFRDCLRRSPLILCAFMEPDEWGASIAMTLIENGTNVAQRDCYGRNVLHYACIYEREKLVRVLLRAIDFDLNQSDKTGNTALHYAAMSGNVVITQLIAQSFKRYKISPNKINRQARTACEEALHAGNTACVHAIQTEMASQRRPASAMKDVRFAENDVILGSSSSRPASQYLSPLIKRRALRPTSAAFLTRRDSASSFASADDRRSSLTLRSSSIISLPISGNQRKSPNPLYTYGYKKDEEIIHCAAENDFRNTPEYVLKLVHLSFDPNVWDSNPVVNSNHKNSCSWTDGASTCQSQQMVAGMDWRVELKRLFKVYEDQCSSSWRATIPPDTCIVEHDPSCPGPEEEEKGRRGRRHSVVGKNAQGHVHGKEGAPELKRRQSTVRLRKVTPIASMNKFSGGASMDGSLDTSSESINSLASGKKRNLDKEGGLVGRSGHIFDVVEGRRA